MDKMIRAISRASTEVERRKTLKDYASRYPKLLEEPDYPTASRFDDPNNLTRDYTLFTANFSCFGRRKKLLFRYVYTAEFGPSRREDEDGLDLLGFTSQIEMAASKWFGSPPYWEQSSHSLLSKRMEELMDERMIENFCQKIEPKT